MGINSSPSTRNQFDQFRFICQQDIQFSPHFQDRREIRPPCFTFRHNGTGDDSQFLPEPHKRWGRPISCPGNSLLESFSGLPDFCHLLRVVGNSIPPYIKDKWRSAKESASCGWQNAAQKECLFGSSRRFLGRAKFGTIAIDSLRACPGHGHSK